MKSLRINGSLGECLPNKSTWCWVEQVCLTGSSVAGYCAIKELPFCIHTPRKYDWINTLRAHLQMILQTDNKDWISEIYYQYVSKQSARTVAFPHLFTNVLFYHTSIDLQQTLGTICYKPENQQHHKPVEPNHCSENVLLRKPVSKKRTPTLR